MASAPRMETEPVASKRPVRPAAGTEDRTLVAQSQRGSKPAFEELVRRHQHRVFAVAGGILRRREDVEDVTQQVFIKAFLSLPRFDQRAAFSTWLYKITVNECWDFLRKKKVRPLVYESDLSEEQARQFNSTAEPSTEAGADPVERLDSRQRVESLLKSLDQRDQLMLILKEVDGFSVEEIGEILNLNSNTVKVRLFRARRKMVALHQKRSRRQQAGD
jgi:RNA polymerase sigma-70 factor (ECF subfamily)